MPKRSRTSIVSTATATPCSSSKCRSRLSAMKIEQRTVQQKRLSVAEAELWVLAHVPSIRPTPQILGNLSGPFCAKAQTIQIAYAIKAIHPPGFADNVLVGRILIPEPNLWTVEM